MTINMPSIVVRQTVQWRDADFSSRKARRCSIQVTPSTSVPNIDPGDLGADLNLQTRRFTNGFTFRLFRSAPLRQ